VIRYRSNLARKNEAGSQAPASLAAAAPADAPEVAAAADVPTKSATRHRRYRERRRKGTLVVQPFELTRDALNFLIGHGVFSERDLEDGRTAAAALQKYFAQLSATRRAW
jgi:hypothetical protein